MEESAKAIRQEQAPEGGLGAGAPPTINSLVEQLASILTPLVERLHDGSGPTDTPQAETDFGRLGLNSVDYLEFVLEVETQLSVDIPDEALLDPKLNTLRSWASYLHENRAVLARQE